jgi:aspartyl-tRNA(Asn)/glutamyl-tRNA(Gln) amidotransferase subunit A
MTDLRYITIAEAARLIKARRLSPVELVNAKLKLIDSLEPKLDAFITPTAERAVSEARAAEAQIAAGRYLGPLHGIPFGLKDIFETAGIKTTANSKILLNHVPRRDATASRLISEAGGVLMGKLATWEFAHGGPAFDLPFPPTRNPWNLACATGGSSTGPAAAVAAGLLPAALGSDTGGSIRNPAAFCAIVGLKPTFGLVSRSGVVPNSFSFDHSGPMTATVEDCAILLQVIAAFDPLDSTSANRAVPDYRKALTKDLRGIRVGVIRHYWEDDHPAAPEVRTAMEHALNVLKGLGAELEDARMPSLQAFYDTKICIAESELFATYEHHLRERPGDFSADFLARSLAACLFRGVDYVQAQRERRRLIADMSPLYERFDVLVSAGPPNGGAPRFEKHRTVAFWQKPSSSATPFNVTGGPAISICNGFTTDGMPLGMQVAGRPFADDKVLRVAYAYEQATDWHHRRPPLDETTPKPVVQSYTLPDTLPDIDRDTMEIIETRARRAGLRLTEQQFILLAEAAPYALAMAARLRGPKPWDLHPADVFRLPVPA